MPPPRYGLTDLRLFRALALTVLLANGLGILLAQQAFGFDTDDAW